MTRRIAVIVVLAIALAGGGSAAQAGPVGNTMSSNWGCVGSQTLDKVVCLSNPLPERLPLPN